jgi:hypothetical protein
MKAAAGRRRFRHAVKSKQPKVNKRCLRPILCTGAGERMTAERAAQLKQLAQDAYEGRCGELSWPKSKPSGAKNT